MKGSHQKIYKTQLLSIMVFKMINIFLKAVRELRARQNYKPSLREGQISLQYSRTHQYKASF